MLREKVKTKKGNIKASVNTRAIYEDLICSIKIIFQPKDNKVKILIDLQKYHKIIICSGILQNKLIGVIKLTLSKKRVSIKTEDTFQAADPTPDLSKDSCN